MIYEDNVEKYVSIINGKTFIKNATFIDDARILFISFYNSYNEYKDLNPNTPITEEDYIQYFGTGEKVEKILVEDTARLLMVFPNIDTVSVTLKFNNQLLTVNVGRETLNSLIGMKIEELSADNGTWQESFVKVYTAGLKNDKRKQLLEHFLAPENKN